MKSMPNPKRISRTVKGVARNARKRLGIVGQRVNVPASMGRFIQQNIASNNSEIRDKVRERLGDYGINAAYTETKRFIRRNPETKVSADELFAAALEGVVNEVHHAMTHKKLKPFNLRVVFDNAVKNQFKRTQKQSNAETTRLPLEEVPEPIYSPTLPKDPTPTYRKHARHFLNRLPPELKKWAEHLYGFKKPPKSLSQIAREEGMTAEGVRITLERAFMRLRTGIKPASAVPTRSQLIARQIKRAIVRQGKGNAFTKEEIVRAVQRKVRAEKKEVVTILERIIKAARRRKTIRFSNGKYTLRSNKPA